MLGKLRLGMDDMALAILIWLCTLPLLGLLVVPFFGLKAGVFVAMLICWGICSRKIFNS
jgi:hypothetical protein